MEAFKLLARFYNHLPKPLVALISAGLSIIIGMEIYQWKVSVDNYVKTSVSGTTRIDLVETTIGTIKRDQDKMEIKFDKMEIKLESVLQEIRQANRDDVSYHRWVAEKYGDDRAVTRLTNRLKEIDKKQ